MVRVYSLDVGPRSWGCHVCCVNDPQPYEHPDPAAVPLSTPAMDCPVVFAALESVCEDSISVLRGPSDLPYSAVAQRLVTCMREIQEHGRALQPVVRGFVAVFHHYDFDAETPGNGYRTLVKVRLVPPWAPLCCSAPGGSEVL